MYLNSVNHWGIGLSVVFGDTLTGPSGLFKFVTSLVTVLAAASFCFKVHFLNCIECFCDLQPCPFIFDLSAHRDSEDYCKSGFSWCWDATWVRRLSWSQIHPLATLLQYPLLVNECNFSFFLFLTQSFEYYFVSSIYFQLTWLLVFW